MPDSLRRPASPGGLAVHCGIEPLNSRADIYGQPYCAVRSQGISVGAHGLYCADIAASRVTARLAGLT
jgi:hypothetical protein